MTNQMKTGLLAAGLVGAGFLLFATVIGVVMLTGDSGTKRTSQTQAKPKDVAEPAPSTGIFGPSASSEGEKWTIREMIGHLQHKGLIDEDAEVKFSTPLGIPHASIQKKGSEVFEIFHFETKQKAKDFSAGRNRPGRHSWGRFSITGEQQVVSKIAAKLD